MKKVHNHVWKWSPIGSLPTAYCTVPECDRVKRKLPDGSHTYSNDKIGVIHHEQQAELARHFSTQSPKDIAMRIASDYPVLGERDWEHLVDAIERVVRLTRQYERGG